jgi:hypothetical protein
MTSHVRRWARAVDDNPVAPGAVMRVEGVVRVIDLLEREATRLKSVQQSPRPFRVFVQDSDRSRGAHGRKTRRTSVLFPIGELSSTGRHDPE